MKNFKDFIEEAHNICNNTPKGKSCPSHGNESCEAIKSHKTVEEIAKKHRLDVSFIKNQLKIGLEIEREHTKDKDLATDIALQHLDEIPDYYTRLTKMETSAKNEHQDLKAHYRQIRGESNGYDIEEKITVEDAYGNPFLEFIDIVKPDPLIKEEINTEKRYCTLCKKEEDIYDCSYGPKMWKKFSIATVHPTNENYLRIQTSGSTYTILLNWRGKYITTQMFFSQYTRPTKKEVTNEIRKVYPNAVVLSFNPSLKDPTKPLLFTGDLNGPKRY